MRLPILAIAAVAFALPRLPAQTHRVVPAGATYDEGNGRSFFPFVLQGGRAQQITAGNEIAGTSAILRELAFRRDGAGVTAFPARSFPRFLVTIGTTRVAPAAMSTTFASNRGTSMRQVFAGAFNAPAQPVTGGKAGPFNIPIKFSTPFVFRVANSNLVWEIEIPGRTMRRVVYFIDGQAGASGGSTRRFGTSGRFASLDAYSVRSDPAALVTGGRANLIATGLKRAYPTIGVYGFSNTRFGTIPLPFDLTPIGAPGNKLHVSIDLALPFALAQQGTTFGGTLALPIPSAPLVGLPLFGQMLFADAQSNGLGFVFSNGVEMVIGSTSAASSRAIGAYDSSATIGTYAVTAGVRGGIVARYSGTFN